MSTRQAPISVIDWSAWRSDGDATVAGLFVKALLESGFAYIGNHGVPAEVIDAAFGAAESFFAMDPAQLDDVHYRHAHKFHGFVPRGEAEGMGPYHEWYDVGRETTDSYSGPGSKVRSVPNLWPALPEFKATIQNYQAAMRTFADSLLAAVAVGVSLPSDFFAVRCLDAHVLTRLLHHVPPPDDVDVTHSVGEHCDYEIVTILYQDDVGGLQVRAPGADWVDVSPVDGAYVVTAGDMLAYWTNGVIPATPHRVRSPSSSDRYSIAYFYATSYDVIMEPALPPPAGAKRQDYIPVATGDYIERREGGSVAASR